MKNIVGTICSQKLRILFKNRDKRESQTSPLFERASRGLTILEYVIALGLGLVFLAAIYGAATSGKNQSEASAVVQNAMQIQSEMHTLYPSNEYGTGDLTAALIAEGDIPTNLAVTGGTILGPYPGSTFDIAANGATFTISLYNVPSTGCGQIIQMAASQGSWIGIGAGGSITPLTPGMMITSPEATSMCGGSTNTVTFESN